MRKRSTQRAHEENQGPKMMQERVKVEPRAFLRSAHSNAENVAVNRDMDAEYGAEERPKFSLLEIRQDDEEEKPGLSAFLARPLAKGVETEARKIWPQESRCADPKCDGLIPAGPHWNSSAVDLDAQRNRRRLDTTPIIQLGRHVPDILTFISSRALKYHNARVGVRLPLPNDHYSVLLPLGLSDPFLCQCRGSHRTWCAIIEVVIDAADVMRALNSDMVYGTPPFPWRVRLYEREFEMQGFTSEVSYGTPSFIPRNIARASRGGPDPDVNRAWCTVHPRLSWLAQTDYKGEFRIDSLPPNFWMQGCRSDVVYGTPSRFMALKRLSMQNLKSDVNALETVAVDSHHIQCQFVFAKQSLLVIQRLLAPFSHEGWIANHSGFAVNGACVYYPSDVVGTPCKKLLVSVWIYGGGYVAGRASIYNGKDIIDQGNHGVVVVTTQYRLGLFGFLSGAEVKASGALNAGLLDQDFAFRWVKKHISKFGGDPSKVTIWGLSAGAGSALQHVVANNGKTTPQLFRGLITSSTFLPSQYNYNDRIPEVRNLNRSTFLWTVLIQVWNSQLLFKKVVAQTK
ncbi:hypothetical protein B0H19DRAFT_1348498 [Mycena capillaripes]|nr:hypothetical protein B0H19DRAFT_1348498 [Mycena capillaripes]